MDLSISCRLCFKDKGSDYVNIFTNPLRNYPLQVNEMFQTELMDLPHWPNSACINCVAKLDDLLLFKETVITTQLQIQEETNRNIKTEPTNVAGSVETYWCPTPGVSHVKTEESTAEPEQFEDDEEMECEEQSPTEGSDVVESESEDSNSDDESEEFDEQESKYNPLEGKKKYSTNPKMPQDKIKLKLEAHFKSMGLLTCHICKAETAYSGQLVKHVKECHENIKYIYCCGLIAKNVPDIYDHMEFHLNPEKFKCEHCHKVLKGPKSLSRHIKERHEKVSTKPKKVVKIRRPTGENLLNHFKKSAEKTNPEDFPIIEEMRRRNLLVCSICNNDEHENMFYLFVHMMEVHNTRGFMTCCGRRLAQKEYAYQHMRAHLDPDAFKCEHCEKRFLTRLNRSNHTVRYHTAVADHKFQCETCGKSYPSKPPLIRHQISHLPDEQRPHRCTVCGKGFLASFQLKGHVDRVHNVQNNFVCDVCGKGFTTNAILRGHKMCLHDEDFRDKSRKRNLAPTPCPKCGKVIALTSVKKHLLEACPANANNLLPPVPCNLCGKRVSVSSMRMHLRSACPANGKQYFCSVCNKECKSAKSLACHVRVHDPNWSLAYKLKK